MQQSAPAQIPAITQPIAQPVVAPAIDQTGQKQPATTYAPGKTTISRWVLLGGLMGLIGGLLSELLLYLFGNTIEPDLLYDFLAICGGGLVIGALLGGIDGYAVQSARQALRAAGRGAIIGVVIALIAGVVAEFVHTATPTPGLNLIISWIVLGAVFGSIQWARRRSWSAAMGGIVGGALGGLIGGLLAQLNIPFGIALVGLFAVLLGELLRDLTKRAWVRVVNKQGQEGREAAIDRRKMVLGSGDLGQVDIGLYKDNTILYHHAELQKKGKVFQLAPLVGASVSVNGASISQPTPLADGDTMQMGNTTLIFHESKSRGK